MTRQEKSPHLILRHETRQLLSDIGVPSNPGFLDHDIIRALREKAELPPTHEWDEWSKNSYLLFRNGLIQILLLKDVDFPEENINLDIITDGLRTLLLN